MTFIVYLVFSTFLTSGVHFPWQQSPATGPPGLPPFPQALRTRLHMAAQSTPSLTSGCSENPGSVGTYTENSCESEEAWSNKGVGR